MAANEGHERTLVLVKALPHVGKGKGEIVCCAGVTPEGEWRRQYPVRFRHLRDKKFSRWQWIEYDWRRSKPDPRPESRRVQEDTIQIGNTMPPRERAPFLAPIIVGSVTEAAQQGKTLALVRPRDIQFNWAKKSPDVIEAERRAYAAAANQASFFDDDLKALNPCPYAFRFRYSTEDGPHENTCEDWETTAMFYSFSRLYGEEEALKLMSKTFAEEYPKKGVAFALGTHSRFPKSWLLVGVIRLDEVDQPPLL